MRAAAVADCDFRMGSAIICRLTRSRITAVLLVATSGLVIVTEVAEVMEVPAAAADETAPTEHEVKAAFLYNFGKFVVWPDAAFKVEGVLVIGVLGDDPIIDVLERTVRDKQVQDRRIDVKRLRSAREAPGCQILFISASERERVGDILQRLDRSSVLTVSDMSDFAENGGMISLLLEQKKVRFTVNLSVVEQAGLKMSSQLLKLAKRVIRPPAPGPE